MRPERLGRLCNKLGVTLSEDDRLRVLNMSNREGDGFVRRVGKQTEIDLDNEPLLVRSPCDWTDECMADAANYPGRSLKAMHHAKDEYLRLEYRLARSTREIKVREDILMHLQKDEDLVGDIREAEEAIRLRHHPESKPD